MKLLYAIFAAVPHIFGHAGYAACVFAQAAHGTATAVDAMSTDLALEIPQMLAGPTANSLFATFAITSR